MAFEESRQKRIIYLGLFDFIYISLISLVKVFFQRYV